MKKERRKEEKSKWSRKIEGRRQTVMRKNGLRRNIIMKKDERHWKKRTRVRGSFVRKNSPIIFGNSLRKRRKTKRPTKNENEGIRLG